MYKLIEYVNNKYELTKDLEFVNQFVYGSYGKYPVYPLYTMDASKLSYNKDYNYITFYTHVKIKRALKFNSYLIPFKVTYKFSFLDDDIMSNVIRQFHRGVYDLKYNINIKSLLNNKDSIK